MPENAKFTKSVKVVHLEPESQRVMRARLARLPAAVHVLHEKAKHLISQKLKSFFDKADDSLFELADKAHSNQEQNLFFDSMREVRVQRRGIEKRFSAAIDLAFANLVVSEVKEQQDEYQDTLSADALSLVQNEDLEEMVAIESSISRANSEFGEAIQHISLRLDSLVPVKVYQKNNPIGPDVLCDAFMSEAKKLDVDIKAKLVLFKLFDRTVVSQLGDVYRAANQVLIDHNVLPSLTTGGRSSATRQSTTAENTYGEPSSHHHQQANQEVISALQGMLGGQISQQTPVSDGHQLLQLLSVAQKMPAANQQSMIGVDVRSLLGEMQRTTGGAVTIGRMDDEIINLVNMLFDFILEDRNLADPMKALISRMQIPMVKVALVDKTFFTKGGHAARRLLNEMATAALGWQGDLETGERDPLYKKMEGVVRRLIEDFDTDVSIFSELLADFTSFIEKEKRRVAVLERRTLDAEDGKAKAEVARTIVAVEIELRTINESLPQVVSKLISDAWQNVLFVVGLKHGYDSEEWHSALKTLEDLVWSVRVPESDADRQRLIRLVPDLLSRLRGGLDTISFNPFVMSELFKSLEEVHLGCIRGKSAAVPLTSAPAPKAPTPKEEIEPAPIENEMPTAAAEANGDQPSMMDLDQMPEMDTLGDTLGEDSNEDFIDQPGTNVQPEKEEILADDDTYMKQVAGFVQGAWFEMLDPAGASIRCRLAAVIKPTGKYIFVNRNGMKVAEKTQQELASALKQDRIRALDNSMLFDRALETVVSSLRKSH